MNKSLFFAVILFSIATFVASADDYITIKNLVPANGTVVNDCPVFTWSKRNDNSIKYTISIYNSAGKAVPGTPFELVTTKFAISPYSIDGLLDVDTYRWQVTTDKGDKSEWTYFSVKEKSCIPPFSENKINNDLKKFDDKGTTYGGQQKSGGTRKYSEQSFSLNGKNVVFKPVFPDDLILAVQLHETYPEENMDKGREYKTLDVKCSEIIPDINDNVLAFRYVYFTTGNSTITIRLVDDKDKEQKLGCIGEPINGYDECEEGYAVATSAYTLRFSNGLLSDPLKWTLFSRNITVEKGRQYTLHFDYTRAKKYNESDELYKNSTIANFIFFASAFVVGQCSTVPDEYFPVTVTQGEFDSICPKCGSAGIRIPKVFNDGQCVDCEDVTKVTDVCPSIDYCVPCLGDNICQPSSSSNCKENAKCSEKTKQNDCKGSCEWCNVEEKCTFYEDGTCGICGSFDSMDSCEKHPKSCSWCPTLQVCIPVEDKTCPPCEWVDKNKCESDLTDGKCEYCNKLNKCLNTSTVCDDTCREKTSKDTCTGADCTWCVSSQTCKENRQTCDDCHLLSNDECKAYTHPGCQLCETGSCMDKTETCPTCKERSKDECELDGVKCKYCYSARECMPKDKDCTLCSNFTDEAGCGTFKGCVYCKSDLVCKSEEEDTTECDCNGLTPVACKLHGKGCCYSENDKACFVIGNNKCSSTFDTKYIIVICVCGGVLIVGLAVLIPVLVFCCKPKTSDGIEMTAPGTIVVLPEGQPSMVVAQESLQSVNVDPATAVSVDETTTATGIPASNSVQDMQNMMAQQQMLNTMMAQQQMSMMMNPMMMNSMGMMNMSGMPMSGMNNSMGMDMNSMGMTGGMSSMNMTGGMQGMNQQSQGNTVTDGGTI